MKNHYLLIMSLALFFYCCQQQNKAVVSNSKLTKGESSQVVLTKVKNRELSIYLPPKYSKDSIYKVVYFHDGQDLFRSELWDLQNLLDDMISRKVIDPIVLVGIHSTRERSSDLVPYEDNYISSTWGAYEPRADLFSTLIQNSIIPFVQNNYQVSDQIEDRALFGASFGGLHAIWEASQYPERWGMVAGFSPSAWVANYALFKTVESSKWKQTKLWFDIGTGEWNYYVPLIEPLVNKGLSYGEELFYLEVPMAQHVPRDWRQRIIYPLIVFAGKEDYSVKSMKVEVEYIPSQSSNRVYQRINPIITLMNGVQFSAANQAKYQLLNSNTGEVKADGRFQFTGNESLEVKVSFKGLEEVIVIKK